MFHSTKALLFATAAMVMAPALASAAVISNDIVANQNFSGSAVLSPGETIEFQFDVLEDLVIDSFSLSGTGTSGEQDLQNIRFGFTEPLTGMFTTITSQGSVSAGFGFLSGLTLDMGSVFSVFFDDGITNDVAVTLSFVTDDVAPVPLPATVLLLGPVLLAGGLAKRRRQKTAAAR